MTAKNPDTMTADMVRHNTRFIHANGKTYMVAGEVYPGPDGSPMLSYFTLRDGRPAGATHKCGLDKVKEILPDLPAGPRRGTA